MALKIDILAETRNFMAGVDDVESALDDVADALDGVARDADKAGDKLEDSFKNAGDSLDDLGKAGDTLDDLGRDAKQAGDKIEDGIEQGTKGAEDGVEKLERSFRDMAKAVKKDAKASGDALSKEIKHGADGAEDGLDNMKEESKQTAREAAASFDGSAESIISAFQEVAANAFIGFGPAGMVAGLGIAAGIGLAIQAGQSMADTINEAKTRVGELALALYDVDGDISKLDIGQRMRDWGVDIADNREWWEFWQEEAVSNLDKVRDNAKKFGVDIKDMFGAMSGMDADAGVRVLETLHERLDELHDGVGEEDFWGIESNGIRGLISEIEKSTGITEDASEAQKLLREASAEATEQAELQAAAEEARNDAISALQAPIDNAIGSFAEYKDAETGTMDPQAYIDGIAKRIEATTNFNSNVQGLATRFGLTQEEIQTILDQGIEFAPMLQSIVDAGLDDEFVGQIRAGVGGGQSILDNNPFDAEVNVTTDVKPAVANIRQAERAKYKADIKASATTTGAENALDKTAKRRTATIVASAQTANANYALNNVARTRYATIVANVRDRYGRSII